MKIIYTLPVWRGACMFLIPLFLLLLSTFSLQAQDYSYSFSENNTYEETTGTTKIDLEDTSVFEIKADLNETIMLFGEKVELGKNGDHVAINKGGLIRINYGVKKLTMLGFAMGADLVVKKDKSSEISYKVEGGKLIVQYKNMGFRYGKSTDYVNFKIIAELSDGSFDVHYGGIKTSENSYSDGAGGGTGPSIGFHFVENNQLKKHGFLKGPFDSPSIGKFGEQMNGGPDSGMIYRFTSKATSSVNEITDEAKILVYPNPSIDHIYVDLNKFNKAVEVKILNSYGQLLSTKVYDGKEVLKIQVNDLSAGNYILQVNRAGLSPMRFKFVKI